MFLACDNKGTCVTSMMCPLQVDKGSFAHRSHAQQVPPSVELRIPEELHQSRGNHVTFTHSSLDGMSHMAPPKDKGGMKYEAHCCQVPGSTELENVGEPHIQGFSGLQIMCPHSTGPCGSAEPNLGRPSQLSQPGQEATSVWISEVSSLLLLRMS